MIWDNALVMHKATTLEIHPLFDSVFGIPENLPKFHGVDGARIQKDNVSGIDRLTICVKTKLCWKGDRPTPYEE